VLHNIQAGPCSALVTTSCQLSGKQCSHILCSHTPLPQATHPNLVDIKIQIHEYFQNARSQTEQLEIVEKNCRCICRHDACTMDYIQSTNTCMCISCVPCVCVKCMHMHLHCICVLTPTLVEHKDCMCRHACVVCLCMCMCT
jgi:hypothetical protein